MLIGDGRSISLLFDEVCNSSAAAARVRFRFCPTMPSSRGGRYMPLLACDPSDVVAVWARYADCVRSVEAVLLAEELSYGV